jgi:hypothetical protein
MPDDQRLIALLNDRVLRPLLDARTDDARVRVIGELLVMQATPIIERVLARAPAVVQPHDRDDIAGTVTLGLTRKLHLVPFSADEGIRDFQDYVAKATFNGVQDFVRRHFPQRTRLENRLRYLLSRDPRLAIWDSPRGTLCGLARWSESEEFATILPDTQRRNDDISADGLVTLFEAAGHPVPFQNVAASAAVLWGVTDDPPSEVADDLPDERPGQGARLESKQLAQIIWSEIQTLPERQRIALLLNLRDSVGLNALVLFPLTGVASFTELASTVGMTPPEFAAIWNDLPLDDLRIAGIMNGTRQQIINLRKSARERLQRRLARRNHPLR